MNNLLTVRGAAKFMKVSHALVSRWVTDGLLTPAHRLSERHVYLDKKVVERFMRSPRFAECRKWQAIHRGKA